MSYRDKLSKSGPRKLLALDDGGIFGVITFEVLVEIEYRLAMATLSIQLN